MYIESGRWVLCILTSERHVEQLFAGWKTQRMSSSYSYWSVERSFFGGFFYEIEIWIFISNVHKKIYIKLKFCKEE